MGTDPVRLAKAAAERVRIAQRHAEIALRRAVAVHTKAAELFERLGKVEQAAHERAKAAKQLEGAESERAAQVA